MEHSPRLDTFSTRFVSKESRYDNARIQSSATENAYEPYISYVTQAGSLFLTSYNYTANFINDVI